MSAYAAYDAERTTQRMTPVKLSEMTDTVDAVASEHASTQRALVAAGLRAEPSPAGVRRVVVLETVLELLAALEADKGLAKRVSQLMAERRREFA